MSIASRITAIEEHIRDVYDTIDYSYDTTDVDKNIKNIPQNIFNGYINVLNDNGQSLWNNLTKVSQADVTEAELSNVVTAPMKIDLKGNTSQETTSGKQKLPTNQIRTDKDFLTVNEDGSITIIYESGSNINYTNLFTETLSIPTGNYKLKLFVDGTFVGGNMLITNSNNTTITQSSIVDGRVFTITNNDIGNIQLYVLSAGTKCTIKMELEEGTTEPTSYEPYTGGIPSPNPDYPQEVKVVKGNNVVSVQGKNLLNMNYLVEANADKTYAPQGFWAFKLTDVVGIYTLSRANADMVSGGSYIAWGEGNDIATAYNGKTWIAHQSQPTLNHKSQTKNNSGELWIFLSTNESRIQNIPNDYGYLMLEQGSTATDFVPYSHTDYPLNLGNIELCKTRDYQDYLYKSNGNWYKHKVINKHLLKPSSVSLEENGIRARYTVPIPVNTYPPAYCNYFGIATTYAQTVNSNGETPNRLNVNATGTLLCNVAGYTTTTEYIDLFANNDIYLYYPLATPTEEQITDTTLIYQLEAISNAKSVEDKTYITQTNDDLPFILDVEAIKEYEVN